MTELLSSFVLWILLFPVSAPVHFGQEQNFLEKFSFFGLQIASECPYK